MNIKTLAKNLAVKVGAFDLHRRIALRQTLTVLMFHRVLPAKEIERRSADPTYTISLELFRQLLRFLKLRYQVVSMADALAARKKNRPLPRCALMITFDDGWADNREFAAPALASEGMPWTLFVSTDALNAQPRWWQEQLSFAVRSGAYSQMQLAELARTDGLSHLSGAHDLLKIYSALDPAVRNKILSGLSTSQIKTAHPDMLDDAGLRDLSTRGVAIGLHGASHVPLTALNDPEADILRCHEYLRTIFSVSAETASFPHGLYNGRIVHALRSVGVSLMFTSDQVLNACPNGWIESDLLGRIPISGPGIANSGGDLDLGRLIPRLSLRPRRTLDTSA